MKTLFLLATVAQMMLASCNLSTDGGQNTIDPDSVMLRKPISNISIKSICGEWFSSFKQSNLGLNFGSDMHFTSTVNGMTETKGDWRLIETDSIQFSSITNDAGEVAASQTFKIRGISDSVFVIQSRGASANEIYFKGDISKVAAQDYFSGDIDGEKTILISVGADVKTHIAIAANKAGVKFQLLDGGDNAIGDENTDWVGTLASGDYKIKITSQQATKFDIAIAQVRE